MNLKDRLQAELDAARARVAGKTFAEAAELFKDVERIKVLIWTSAKKQKRAQRES